MAVTIRDVARAAGVSTSTVSRTLSRPELVDAGTAERVTRIAEHLGYHPNRAARSLITGRTGNLGLILPDLTNPFFPAVVKGIQRRAQEADYQVFVADTDEDPSVELGLVRSLSKQVDGIILCSPRMRSPELQEAATLAPVVLVSRRAGSIPSVAIDNVEGMAQVIDHLAHLGHARIGFVGGPRSSWSNRERLRGLRAASDAAAVTLVDVGNFAPTFDGGVDATRSALLSGVTAVIAYNDLVALGLMHGLHDQGIDIPRDISVVGIDNIHMAALTRPGLTSLAIPKEKAGRASVDLLLHLLGVESTTTPVREVAMELIVRHTTATAPAHAPTRTTLTTPARTSTPRPSGRRHAVPRGND
jgi:LacI family transcriptional regulator